MNSPTSKHVFRMTDGKSSYQMIRPWQKDTQQARIESISQLAVDSSGRVFVLQRSAPHVLIYSATGDLECAFNDPRITSGHGLFIDMEDRLFVVSYDSHQVLVFDRELQPLFALGTLDSPSWNAPFNHPTDVAVAMDGEIYVSDGYGNACVHRFSATGAHLSTWGSVGDGPGQFSTPHGIWVLEDNRVAVCDRDNDRIQVFNREGHFLEPWTNLVRPMDIWSDGTDVFVVEQTPRISRLDMNGVVQGRFRTFGVYPHGIWGAADGSLFVAEQGPTHCVTKYARTGPATAPSAQPRELAMSCD